MWVGLGKHLSRGAILVLAMELRERRNTQETRTIFVQIHTGREPDASSAPWEGRADADIGTQARGVDTLLAPLYFMKR